MSTTAAASGLPERQRVAWRRRVDDATLRRAGRHWTLWTLGHSVPFVLAAGLLVAVKPILAPLAALLVVHAWVLALLYARRGARVLSRRPAGASGPEARALLMLGDLVDGDNRRLHEATGLVIAPGRFGTWVVGEAGALLVRRGGRRVDCYCVRVNDATLPHGDRVAHLLLALRCDEPDFATIANLAFSGACWRVRRRLAVDQRPALAAAIASARRTG